MMLPLHASRLLLATSSCLLLLLLCPSLSLLSSACSLFPGDHTTLLPFQRTWNELLDVILSHTCNGEMRRGSTVQKWSKFQIIEGVLEKRTGWRGVEMIHRYEENRVAAKAQQPREGRWILLRNGTEVSITSPTDFSADLLWYEVAEEAQQYKQLAIWDHLKHIKELQEQSPQLLNSTAIDPSTLTLSPLSPHFLQSPYVNPRSRDRRANRVIEYRSQGCLSMIYDFTQDRLWPFRPQVNPQQHYHTIQNQPVGSKKFNRSIQLLLKPDTALNAREKEIMQFAEFDEEHIRHAALAAANPKRPLMVHSFFKQLGSSSRHEFVHNGMWRRFPLLHDAPHLLPEPPNTPAPEALQKKRDWQPQQPHSFTQPDSSSATVFASSPAAATDDAIDDSDSDFLSTFTPLSFEEAWSAAFDPEDYGRSNVLRKENADAAAEAKRLDPAASMSDISMRTMIPDPMKSPFDDPEYDMFIEKSMLHAIKQYQQQVMVYKSSEEKQQPQPLSQSDAGDATATAHDPLYDEYQSLYLNRALLQAQQAFSSISIASQDNSLIQEFAYTAKLHPNGTAKANSNNNTSAASSRCNPPPFVLAPNPWHFNLAPGVHHSLVWCAARCDDVDFYPHTAYWQFVEHYFPKDKYQTISLLAPISGRSVFFWHAHLIWRRKPKQHAI